VGESGGRLGGVANHAQADSFEHLGEEVVDCESKALDAEASVVARERGPGADDSGASILPMNGDG
jgi:hypothetical protein